MLEAALATSSAPLRRAEMDTFLLLVSREVSPPHGPPWVLEACELAHVQLPAMFRLDQEGLADALGDLVQKGAPDASWSNLTIVPHSNSV